MPARKATSGEYRFKIAAFTPQTIPMIRLAEYMRDLAVMLGNPDAVHFVRVQKGSTVLLHRVDHEAIPKVEERAAAVREGRGPQEALQARETINKRLREDNTNATLLRGARSLIIRFPGRDEVEEPQTAFAEEGSIDGIPIRVGGESDPCPVHLQSTDQTRTYLCDIDRLQAKKLATCLFDTEIRAHGVGRWIRDEKGSWSLERFRIRTFEPLNDLPLSAVVANLRTVTGSDWPRIENPWKELHRFRHGPDSDNDNEPHK